MSLVDASGLAAVVGRVVDRSSAHREAHPSWESLDAFWEVFRRERRDWAFPIDQAIAGGALADRVGYAFAAGYQAALQRLDPQLPLDQIACISVTEEEGGHPRAIRSTLVPDAGGSWRLSGRKKWATLSSHGVVALVAASVGQRAEGQNQLRIARVPLDAPGVRVEVMPPTDFVPEIAHGRLSFTDVHVAPADVLDGDGYTEFVRPFRTLEDIFVTAAVLAYMTGIALRFAWPREMVADLLHVLVGLRALGLSDPRSPAIQVALEGLLASRQRLMERAELQWELVEIEERMRWQRDRPLTAVAERVRVRRMESAWERLFAPPPP